MYTTAKKFLGKWAVFLKSQAITPRTIPQFSSLSRATANAWAKVNEPIPTDAQLNATAGVAIWRGRN